MSDNIVPFTNQNNPFGDSKLSEKFVWRKKVEKLKKMGISEKKMSKDAKKAIEEERLVWY
jgi:hypothetical protein